MRNQLIQLLRETQSNAWVADQLERSLGQGVSMTVKDTKGDAEFSQLEPSDLTARERKKRETYETTRAYTDEEAVKLIEEAFRTIFVVLPAIQQSALKELHALGLEFDGIRFAVPDEPGREDASHTIESGSERFSEETAKKRVDRFLEKVVE